MPQQATPIFRGSRQTYIINVENNIHLTRAWSLW